MRWNKKTLVAIYIVARVFYIYIDDVPVWKKYIKNIGKQGIF